MSAWLSSTGISHHSLLPHIPSSISPQQLLPGIAPQSLSSSSQPLRLLGDLHPCPGYVRLRQELSDSHSIQATTDQLFHTHSYSTDSDNCPAVGTEPLFHFPHALRADPVLLTLQFFALIPLLYGVLCGYIYSFPLVRSSCPLSDGVLYALLCLKVYS